MTPAQELIAAHAERTTRAQFPLTTRGEIRMVLEILKANHAKASPQIQPIWSDFIEHAEITLGMRDLVGVLPD